VTEEIKKSTAPSVAVRAFCQWINKTIKYDASVPYAVTVRNQRGHCGHHATILGQFCQHVRIPYRILPGLNLY
jgi:transglutaminase-like putative cysteine protease